MKPARSKTKTKTKPSRKMKKSRRKMNVPKGAERPERPEPGKEFDLKELNRLPHHRIVEFPQMKGRTVQRIRFYSSSDENTIAIRFRDRTQLTLSIEPALVLNADLLKMYRWDAETIKEWPPIRSEPRNPNR
ncbi:MAG: hypothetical protein LAO78_05110 [Acidobacteriia bacterium]|nr:hypothetical protein [Terriglobia bacterium]